MEKDKPTRTRSSEPPGNPAASTLGTDEPPLSVQLAFVVQFREGAGQRAQAFAGRVEHMATYQAARFGSVAELVAFLQRVLRSERTDSEPDD